MNILFDNASSVMTVISFITFAGILWWTYVGHKGEKGGARSRTTAAASGVA